ncbi:PTS transporter subunit EIIA [Erysipelothrix sp. HDW6C]|uniref:BglG family transcription antiterminator n=1 Tax=Erysipelothrix sp. HDW6C TaxID=2714930 RepID=UPI00140AA3E0|nr:PTS sugar transporter subunit IIA [Erysipelothrix sp. HDW6C]QIK70633.1 PTS transporter subunit EIIA [Erysipelothrix sp. HDW6C]
MVTTRQRKLIALLKQQQRIMTVAEYANILGVSKRTVYADIETITPDLEASGYRLKSIPGKGLAVEQTEHHALEAVESLEKVSDTESRREAIAKLLIVDEARRTMSELSNMFYVSVSSIRNDLDIIKRSIENGSTARLIISKAGIHIEGTEEEQQQLLIQFNDYAIKRLGNKRYLSSILDFLRQTYGNQLVDTCYDITKEFSESRIYVPADHYLINIINTLVVMTFRSSKGKSINESYQNLFLNEIMELPNILLAKEILSIISSHYPVTFSDADCKFLSQHLIANRIEFVNYRKGYFEYNDSFLNIIAKMERLTGIEIFKYQENVQNILHHLNAAVFRLKTGVNIKNNLTNQIKLEFGMMFNLTWLVLESESEHLGVRFTEDEVGFLMIHFQNIVDLEQRSKRVLIICTNGYTTSQMILNRIRKILPPLDIIETATVDKAEHADVSAVDFIITTVDLSITNVPTIHVSPLIGDEDIKNISAFYGERFLASDDYTSSSFKTLRKFLIPSLVTKSEEHMNKENIIKLMVGKLEAQGYVDQHYLTSVLQRESAGGTDTNHGIAIPHGQLKHVLQTSVAVWFSDTPIKWNNHSIRMAIFFNVAENDLYVSRGILEEIYALIKSDKLAQRLATGMTTQDFIEFLIAED